MLPREIRDLLDRQDGVASRQQLLAAGARPPELQRWRRRRDLVVVHPGVYVDHTGTLSWRQRAWAAVLACEPAALWARSAVHAEDGTADDQAPIQVAVARDRKVVAPPGVRVVRRVRLDERVHWQRQPPRQRYEDAVVDLALAAASPTAAVGLLAAAVQRRRTTAARLRENLMARPRVRGDRWWLCGVLADIGSGASSVLEQGYLDKVERAHGLPSSWRQAAVDGPGGRSYRDVTYDVGLVVELDGRAFHDSVSQRDSDFERDLDAATTGLETLRLTYGQVFDRPCSTAGKVARLLARRGWTGRPRPCAPGCRAARVFDDPR